MSERWIIMGSGISGGQRHDYIDWDEKVRAPQSRVEVSACRDCGADRRVRITIESVQEVSEPPAKAQDGYLYPSPRLRWRESVALAAHSCRPQPQVRDVQLRQHHPR